MDATLDSKPSRPSCKFALLTMKMITTLISGMYHTPRSHSTLAKGTQILEPIMGWK